MQLHSASFGFIGQNLITWLHGLPDVEVLEFDQQHTPRRVWNWAFLGWSDNQPLVAALGLLLAAASLGFLGHNWPPARIFMGDVGSAFLGYTFAVLPVVAA